MYMACYSFYCYFFFQNQYYSYEPTFALQIMKLFAYALDTLQGENRAYFGIFLLTLYSLRRKLKLLRTSGFTYCSEFLEHIISALETR